MDDDSGSIEARESAARLSHDAREAVLRIEPEGSLQLDGTDAVPLDAAVAAGLAECDGDGRYRLNRLGRSVRSILIDNLGR